MIIFAQKQATFRSLRISNKCYRHCGNYNINLTASSYLYQVLPKNPLKMSKTIDLAQLMEDIGRLVLQSSDIIHEISQNMKQVYYKDAEFDPVTSADYLVQMTICNFLSQKYPTIKVVGEENIDSDDEFCKRIVDSSKGMLSLQQTLTSSLQNFPYAKGKCLFNESDLCLWIDPLDCTRGFVNNKKQEVTILVGITYQNRPVAGVIGSPFKINANNKCVYEPSVVFGSENLSNEGNSYEFTVSNQQWKKWTQFEEKNDSSIESKAAISSRRISLKQQHLMNKMGFENVSLGGAGNKVLRMVRKQVSTVMFVAARTSKWDSCAGEAIIRAMKGDTIMPNLKSIDYDPNLSAANEQGWIFCLSKKTLSSIKEVIVDFEEKSLEAVQIPEKITVAV